MCSLIKPAEACGISRRLAARAPGHPISIYWLEYRGTSDEIAMNSYDFSGAILKRRWQTGEQDMRAALRTWRETTTSPPGLTVYPPERSRRHA
jgi:hypothetical protein